MSHSTRNLTVERKRWFTFELSFCTLKLIKNILKNIQICTVFSVSLRLQNSYFYEKSGVSFSWLKWKVKLHHSTRSLTVERKRWSTFELSFSI